jgi:DNA-binding LytR/AlgR family response regulator
VSRKKSPDAPIDNETLSKLYALVVRLVSPLPPVPVQGVDHIALIRPEDIAFITPEKRGLKIVDQEGKSWPRYDNLTQIAKRLEGDPRFFKSHRAFLINVEMVRAIKVGSGAKAPGKVFFRGIPDDLFAEISEDALPVLKKRLGF